MNAAKEKLEIVSGAASPPFRIFAGGLPRRLRRRKRFGLIQEYCTKIRPIVKFPARRSLTKEGIPTRRTMKAFISYRFTGEDPRELNDTLGKMRSVLIEGGHQVFCSFWSEEFFKHNNFTNKQILEYTLEELKKSDAVLVFIKSSEKSEGMLIEVEYALASQKRIILAVKNGVKTTFLHQIANEVIEFESVDDLCVKLKELS